MSRRKNNRKAKNVILSLMLVVAIGVTAALAFLTASETSENLFSVGNVDVTLTEPNWAPDADSDGDSVNDTLSNILAGQVISKDPTITNIGVNNAYAYIMVEVPKAYKTNIVIDGVETEMTHYELFDYVTNEGWSLIDSKVDDNEAYNYYIFAYYDALVPQGQEDEDKVSSATLFDEITFANVTSELVHPLTGEEITDLDVKVTGYAIQSDFYGNEASDAATAWNLYVNQNNWDWPHRPYEGSLADLENKHKFEYYSKFSLAVTDVNNDEIGVNADVDRPDAVAGIYVEEGKAPTVVLFKDAEETGRIDLTTDMNINLAGNTLNLKETSRLNTANNGCNIYIDGRITGSTITSTSTGTQAARCVQILYSDSAIIEDVDFVVSSENGGATACLSGGNTSMNNCNIKINSNAGSANGIGVLGGYAIVSNCTIEVASQTNSAGGILHQGNASHAPELYVNNVTIDVSSNSGDFVYGLQVGSSTNGHPANTIMENANISCKLINNNQGILYGVSIHMGSNAKLVNNHIVGNCSGIMYGIKNIGEEGKFEAINCSVKANSTQDGSYGVNNNGSATLENCTITADSPYKSQEDSYGCSGLDNYGTAFISNCNIKGVHSGIQNSGTLYIDGGTYQGWGHGGFYFTGSNTNAYVKNANIGQWDYDGQYDTAGMTGGNNGSAMYIGGADTKNINVYMDNCKLTALRQCIVLRGTSNEKNNTLYISNSTINTHDIRIDNTTHKLYIGNGCNFDVNSVASNKSVVTQTDEVYIFEMP